MKKITFSICIVTIALMLIALLSCGEEGNDPNYVGTWIHNESMDFNGAPTPSQFTMILSQSNFEWTIGVKADDQYSDIGTVKGDLTATDTELTLMPTSIGMANQDGEYENWVNKGEPGWDAALANWDMQETMTSDYTITDNTLILDIDDVPMDFTRQ